MNASYERENRKESMSMCVEWHGKDFEQILVFGTFTPLVLAAYISYSVPNDGGGFDWRKLLFFSFISLGAAIMAHP